MAEVPGSSAAGSALLAAADLPILTPTVMTTATDVNSAYGDALHEVGGVSTPAGLELSRRSELQATCFEGMSLAALQNGGVSNDYALPALEDSAARGDEYNQQRDHGATATNKVWVERGFYENRVTECNTWLSDASDVG